MKTVTINPITWKHYAAFTVVACWAIGATVLSYDRILHHVAAGVEKQAGLVAAKYAPPVNEVVKYVEQPNQYAIAMPPPLPVAGLKTLQKAAGE